MKNGLTHTEVQKRLQRYGYNELPSTKPKNMGQIALEVIREPLFLLLISCGFLYLLIGNYQEGIILFSSSFLIIFITFYQHQKTEKALEALKNLAAPRSYVLRDGQEYRIPAREVVPGDIILLYEGDRVPADAQLLSSTNLHIDESLLTGESAPVVKNEEAKDTALTEVFSGTLVVQGKGMAEVKLTGISTRFGQIGASLELIKTEQTRMQQEMKGLIRTLFFMGLVISLGVIAAFYFTRGQFIQALLNGLATTMAILPEELPVVLTVFLALGAWRLSKKKVLTRRPSAIETLGSATVLCSDKTGTITQNKMEVMLLFDGTRSYEKHEFQKHMGALSPLICTAHYASVADSIDPMERAFRELFETLGPNEDLPQLVKEYPLQRSLMAMTRVLQSNNDLKAYTKGAPEAVIPLCQLSPQEQKSQLSQVKTMAKKGYRVLALASAALPAHSHLPDQQQALPLLFQGFIALADPIRPEVPAAIAECKAAGVRVIMVTGDYPVTAESIGKQIGLDHQGETLTGAAIEGLSDAQLKEHMRKVSIIARVEPHQKLRIVQALRANHEVVAMTGDGVNDAPALKAAHIGIAMGNKGTDVAREASALVLEDDNFASIVGAIRAGRRIYDNLNKAISYILAIHVPIIGLALIPAFFSNIPILLMPLHIVFMELIIDPVCSIDFESEQEEKNIMHRPPRDPALPFFGFHKILSSLLDGIFLLVVVGGVYFFSIEEGHKPEEVRAIAFFSLILGNLFLILSKLSKTRSFLTVFKERNRPAILILSLAFTLLVLILGVPYLQQLFSLTFPGINHLVPALIGAGLVLLFEEMLKYGRVKRKKMPYETSQN